MSDTDELGIDELVELPPGPQLAAALAGLDPAALNGYDLVELASVYVMQISHLQAGLATVLDQVHHSPPGGADSPPERSEHPHRWAELDVAARLHWSAGKAGYELRYAYHLVRRLPVVHAALAAGQIDWPRARTFVDGLACLDDGPAGEVAAQVLAAGAAGWNVRRLADRLRRVVIAYDAHAAIRRRRERLAQRWVQAEPHPDGTANLYGMHLPAARVVQIVERVTAIARTARRQGDPRSVDQLKADTLCDLLAGTGVAGTPPGPVSDPESGSTPAEQPAPLPGPRRGVIELTVPLSTLVGMSQAPGELTGFGPVIADICRQITVAESDAQWRFSVYDDLSRNGQLAYHGITRARPAGGFTAGDVAFLRARDRTCRGPHGCHTPASGGDIDHTVAKANGGGHQRRNGGPMCRRCHLFKHQSGAALRQPEPGVFEWTTPLGHTYTVRPEPYEESTGPPPAPDDPRQRLARLFTLAA